MARPSNTAVVASRVLRQLRSCGLLLQHGREFPSVTTLVCGEPVAGSWWSHPRANLVYWVLHDLDDSDEVGDVKLINGKVTLVHRALWPALYVIGTAREPWQTRGLKPLARSMLRKTDQAPLRVDQFRTSSKDKPTAMAKLLEKRLLVQSREIHTDSGKHVKELLSWQTWWRRTGQAKPTLGLDDARAAIEARVRDSEIKLPW